jgi:hypothetical protein
MTIAYDKNRLATVDSETGDYLKITQSHHSIPETSFALLGKEGRSLLAADLIGDGKVIETPEGQILLKKWTLVEAWDPRKNTPYQTPTNFEVSQDLIDRLKLFLNKMEQTRGKWAADPEVEFIDGRAGVGASK